MAAERPRTGWGRDAIAVGVVAAVVGAFWWRVLLLKGYLILGDFSMFHVPTAAVYARALAAGRLPLWCEAMGAGYPLLAEGQVGALYPLNLILFSALAPLTALSLGLVLHIAMAGGFAYALGRQMRLSRSGAALAGLTFALSGLMVTYATGLSMIRVIAWLPLLVLCVDRAAEADRPWRWAAAVAAISGMQWLGGHPQMTLFSLATAGGYGVFAVCSTRRGQALTALGRLGAIAAGLLAGGALAAAQTLPTAALYPLTSREYGGSLADRLAQLMPVSHLSALLLPRLFEHEGLDSFSGSLWSCYLGAVALVLAAAAVRRRAPWRVWCWLCLGGAALAVAVLPYPTVLLSHLPFVAGLRFWPRTLWIFGMAASLLAGAGLDLALGSPRFARRAESACLALAALVAAAGAAALLASQGTTAPLLAYFRKPEPWLTAAALGLAGGLLRLHRLGRMGRLGAAAGLLGLNAALLFQFGQPYQPLVERSFYATPPWTASAAAAQGRGERVFSRYVPGAADRLTFGAHREALSKDWPLLYGLRSLEAYSGLPLLRPALFTSVLFEARPAPEAPIWRVTNTGCLITSPLADPSLAHTVVQRTAAPTPRAWLAPAVRRVDSPKAGLGVLLFEDAARADPVEAPPAIRLPEGPAGLASYARVRRTSEMAVEVEVAAARPALLVLADTCCPGWHALVNGKPEPIWPADVMCRGVVVPAGRSQVRFVYEPPGVRIGLWITLVALSGLTGWGVCVVVARRRAGA